MQRALSLSLGVLLAVFAMTCHASEPERRYFSGAVMLEINGEVVKFSRLWECELRTVFRPARRDLFEKDYFQVRLPKSSFVVLSFGDDHAIVLDDWTGCGTERQRAGEWREATIFDNAINPRYGERLYLKVGQPPTIRNPLETPFRVQLLQDSVKELSAEEYGRVMASAPPPHESNLLTRLIEKAAYALTVEVITWNETDQAGLRTGLVLTAKGWVAAQLRAPPSGYRLHEQNERPADLSLFPLPLGYRGPDGKLSVPAHIRVQVDGRILDLDDRGMAAMEYPQNDVRQAKIFAVVKENVWASRCTSLPKPDCPKVPASAK